MSTRKKNNKYAQNAEAVLDLHGFTINEAEQELEDFLSEAKSNNWHRLRIITGKGINSPDGQARLKPWLERYLSQKNYQFRQAKMTEGGEGAMDISI
jgi:DNA-nicking Smr family endonuclease